VTPAPETAGGAPPAAGDAVPGAASEADGACGTGLFRSTIQVQTIRNPTHRAMARKRRFSIGGWFSIVLLL
jgi:hypothetical protein